MEESKPDTRRSFRLSDGELKKLNEIAKHYFGRESGMNTAALKLIIEKEWRFLNG
jgi:hypothetical protein